MSSSGDITVEMLQNILRNVEKDSSTVLLPSLEIYDLCDVQHFCGGLSKTTIRYTKAEDKSVHSLSVVIKYIPKVTRFEVTNWFIREIHMYEEILPRISALLAKGLPDKHKNFTPRAYFTQKSPRHIIALEDLVLKGFKAPERKYGLDLKQCLFAVRTIARFHAASVILLLEDDSQHLFAVFDDYAYREKSPSEVVKNSLNTTIPAMSRIIESWPELGQSCASRLRNRVETVHEDLMNVWKRDDGAFNVLNHGDSGGHNLMYHYSESSGEVDAIMLVDFQCSSYNSPVLDLQQFIFNNANGDVNFHHIDTLLKEYHAELIATLKILGAPKNKTITLTEFLKEFDKKLLHGFLYAICVQPKFSLKDDSNLSADEISHLIATDIHKLESHLSDSYVKYLKLILPYFMEKKII